MKKALSSLGLAIMLVSVPQLLSADEAVETEVVVEEENATQEAEEATQVQEEASETEKVAE